MGDIDSWQGLAALAVSIGFSSIRLIGALLVLPLFSNEVMPALVRNSIFAALGVVVAVVRPADVALGASVGPLLLTIGVELLLGLSIGLLFGVFLWAFEAAGELVDTQAGTAQAQVFDPLSGHEVTLYSEFLGRLAHVVFLAAGGLTLVVTLVLRSFAVWPVGELLPRVRADGALLFADTFGGVFTLIVLLAAPVLGVLFLIDMAMGLVNRFAQRLNVFFLSNSIKSLVSVVLLLLMLPIVAETLVRTLDRNAAETLGLVRSLFGG